MMPKATSIYLVMLGVFGVGLWGILSCGSTYLQAPTDLAGRWELHSSETSVGTGSVPELRIEQSGRFFWMKLDGRVLSLRLESERPIKQSQNCEMRLVGDGVELIMRGSPDADEMHVEAQGAVSGQWAAVRINRVHPGRGNHAPASRPA